MPPYAAIGTRPPTKPHVPSDHLHDHYIVSSEYTSHVVRRRTRTTSDNHSSGFSTTTRLIAGSVHHGLQPRTLAVPAQPPGLRSGQPSSTRVSCASAAGVRGSARRARGGGGGAPCGPAGQPLLEICLVRGAHSFIRPLVVVQTKFVHVLGEQANERGSRREMRKSHILHLLPCIAPQQEHNLSTVSVSSW